jgi:hypothetical protein
LILDFELNGDEFSKRGKNDFSDEMLKLNDKDKKKIEGVDSFFTQEDEDEENEENNYNINEMNYLNIDPDINKNHPTNIEEESPVKEDRKLDSEKDESDMYSEDDEYDNEYFNYDDTDWIWNLNSKKTQSQLSPILPVKYRVFRRIAMAIGYFLLKFL